MEVKGQPQDLAGFLEHMESRIELRSLFGDKPLYQLSRLARPHQGLTGVPAGGGDGFTMYCPVSLAPLGPRI